MTHDQSDKRSRRHFRLKSVDISSLFCRRHSDSEPRWCRMPYPVSIFNLPSLSLPLQFHRTKCVALPLGLGQRLSVIGAISGLPAPLFSILDSLSGIGLPLKTAAAEKNDRVKMRSLLTRCGRWAIHFGRGMTRHFAAVRPKFNALSSLHFLCPLSIIRRSAAFFCNDSSLDTARCPNASLLARSLPDAEGPAGRTRISARWKSSQWNKASKVEFLDHTQWSYCDDSLM